MVGGGARVEQQQHQRGASFMLSRRRLDRGGIGTVDVALDAHFQRQRMSSQNYYLDANADRQTSRTHKKRPRRQASLMRMQCSTFPETSSSSCQQQQQTPAQSLTADIKSSPLTAPPLCSRRILRKNQTWSAYKESQLELSCLRETPARPRDSKIFKREHSPKTRHGPTTFARTFTHWIPSSLLHLGVTTLLLIASPGPFPWLPGCIVACCKFSIVQAVDQPKTNSSTVTFPQGLSNIHDTSKASTLFTEQRRMRGLSPQEQSQQDPTSMNTPQAPQDSPQEPHTLLRKHPQNPNQTHRQARSIGIVAGILNRFKPPSASVGESLFKSTSTTTTTTTTSSTQAPLFKITTPPGIKPRSSNPPELTIALSSSTRPSNHANLDQQDLQNNNLNTNNNNNLNTNIHQQSSHTLITQKQARIIDGTQAHPQEFRYLAALFVCKKPGECQVESGRMVQHCGGTLIAPAVVLTAAHCLHTVPNRVKTCDDDEDNENDWEEPQLIHKKDLFVWIGAHDLNQSSSTEKFAVEEIVLHPEYDYSIKHDFALLRLHDYSTYAGEVELVQQPVLQSSRRTLWVMGWGHTVYTPPSNGDTMGVSSVSSTTPRVARVKLVDDDKCEDTYREDKCFDIGSLLCAGRFRRNNNNNNNNGNSNNNHADVIPTGDACSGDSGGPLVIPGRGYRKDILVGVVTASRDCNSADAPAVYGRVSEVLDWIFVILGDWNPAWAGQRSGENNISGFVQEGGERPCEDVEEFVDQDGVTRDCYWVVEKIARCSLYGDFCPFACTLCG